VIEYYNKYKKVIVKIRSKVTIFFIITQLLFYVGLNTMPLILIMSEMQINKPVNVIVAQFNTTTVQISNILKVINIKNEIK
jgi:hypothetical protein